MGWWVNRGSDQSEANAYNEIGMGTVDNSTKAFLANTLNSITIIVISGTVNVSNGVENVDLVEGSTVTFTATEVIANSITIDASGVGNKAVYATIKGGA
jgi:hypothetical protein